MFAPGPGECEKGPGETKESVAEGAVILTVNGLFLPENFRLQWAWSQVAQRKSQRDEAIFCHILFGFGFWGPGQVSTFKEESYKPSLFRKQKVSATSPFFTLNRIDWISFLCQLPQHGSIYQKVFRSLRLRLPTTAPLQLKVVWDSVTFRKLNHIFRFQSSQYFSMVRWKGVNVAWNPMVPRSLLAQKNFAHGQQSAPDSVSYFSSLYFLNCFLQNKWF